MIVVPTSAILGGGGGISASRLLTPSDPIGYLNSTFLARLQTHLPGSKTPIGLFQDVAGTIPASTAGDLVKCWKDVLSGASIQFTEATNPPTLQFTNGYPVVRGGGSAILTSSANIAPSSIFAVSKGAHDGVAFGRVACSGNANSGISDFSFTGNMWDFKFEGTTYNSPMTTGYDALGMQGGVGTTQWSVNGAITTEPDGNTNAGMGQWTLFNFSGGGQGLNGDIVAVILGGQAYNPTDYGNINTYMTSLKP